MKKLLKIATRGSALSRAQAAIVQRKIEARGYETEIVTVALRSDRSEMTGLHETDGDGLYVRELERVMLTGEADIAIHSAKHLPWQLSPGLVIGGLPDSRDARDMLLINASNSDDEAEYMVGGHVFGLPKGAVVGTESPRRISQLRRLHPDATFRPVRGDITRRIEKLRTDFDGHIDAILLAKADFERMQRPIDDLTKHIFSPAELVPAPCQGLLAAECHEGDMEVLELLGSMTKESDMKRFTVERRLFTALQADHSTPVGIHAEIYPSGGITVYLYYDGKKLIRQGSWEEHEKLCREVIREVSLPAER